MAFLNFSPVWRWLIACLLGASSLAAGSVQAADIAALTQRANAGDLAAMFALGRAYESGDTVPRDDRAAVRWYYRAALKDNVPSQEALAKMNEDGRGVPRSDRIAKQWRDRAAMVRASAGKRPAAGSSAPVPPQTSASTSDRAAAEPVPPPQQPSPQPSQQEAPPAPVDLPKAIPEVARAPITPAIALPAANPLRAIIAQAEAGNADAQYQFGRALETGEGVAKSEARAAHWYFRAARQGFVPAQDALALLNEEGRGVPKNPAIAKLWRERAAGVKGRARGDDLQQLASLEPRARNGDALAQLQVAQIYIERNHLDGALVFLRQAAGQNNPRAQYLLGSMLLDRKEFVGGIEWLERSAKAGDADAQVALGTWYEAPQSGEANQDLAFAWYTKAAERGNAVAHNNLGAMRYDGRGGGSVGSNSAAAEPPAASGGGVAGFFSAIRNAATAATRRSGGKDLNAALRHYLFAAEAGLAEAQYNAALMLGQGLGGDAETTEAERNEAMLKWLNAAAAQGYTRAQAQLARMYLDGDRVEKKSAEAARLFQLAAEADHTWAQYYWGRLLQTGQGTVRNLEEAAKWLERAANNGIDLALLDMAMVYENGLGRPSDNAKAVAFYQSAAKAGSKPAAERLAKVYADGELGVERDLDESNRWVELARQK